MKTIRSMAVLGALLAGVTGCDEAVAPAAMGGTSEMRVGVRGDEPSGGTSGYRAYQSGEASGRVEVEARVWIQARGGEWVELTRGAARQTVEASGRDGVKLLATAEVEARRYRRVRVEFDRVEARTTVGLEIGVGGTGAVATVRVDGGSDGRVVVEREVEVEAEAKGRSQLEIDLNADQWASGSSAGARSVSEAEFRSAVRITAR